MSQPTKVGKPDESVADIIIVATLLFTVLVGVMLLGIF
jgi:hypothetical protein